MEEEGYKESVASLEFSHQHIMYAELSPQTYPLLDEFMGDMEDKNDAIELHLIRTKAYKEAVILHLNQTANPLKRKEFLINEQKTFGGSKIFYLNKGCSKILALAVKDEIKHKLQMVLARLNKVNNRIARYNSLVSKENHQRLENALKSNTEFSKQDELAYFIQKELKH